MANITVSSDIDDLLNAANAAAGAAVLLPTPGYVLASKGTTNQTGIVTSTFTEVTWTEIADSQSRFASNRLTPGNGEVWQINTSITPSGVTGARVIIGIGKNGSEFIRLLDASALANTMTASGSIIVVGNGTDYYNVLFWQDSGSDKTIYAQDGVNNYFSACRIR